jgi:hypothetical protein
MDIASVCGNQGIGFAIVDNDCSRWYQVVAPFTEKKGELLSGRDRPRLCRRRHDGPPQRI